MKIKQASKEFYKEFHHEKIQARLAKMFFMFVSRFHKFYSVKYCSYQSWNIAFSDQICIEQNQSDLTQYKIEYYVIFGYVFDLTGWDVCFFATLTFYPVP